VLVTRSITFFDEDHRDGGDADDEAADVAADPRVAGDIDVTGRESLAADLEIAANLMVADRHGVAADHELEVIPEAK